MIIIGNSFNNRCQWCCCICISEGRKYISTAVPLNLMPFLSGFFILVFEFYNLFLSNSAHFDFKFDILCDFCDTSIANLLPFFIIPYNFRLIWSCSECYYWNCYFWLIIRFTGMTGFKWFEKSPYWNVKCPYIRIYGKLWAEIVVLT